MTQMLLTLLLLVAPVPVLLVVACIRQLSQRAVEEDLSAPKPFEPKPEPKPGFLLRRFSLPQRTYLRGQVMTAKIGFCIVVWCVAVLGSSSLLPGSADNPYGWSAGDPAQIWGDYLQSMFLLNSFGTVLACITAMTAGFGITANGPGMMNRTRPVTHRMLYWGRVGAALMTLLAGYATGIAGALALLLALHGRVWQHLNVNGQGLAITLKQMHRLAWMMNISLPRLLVSVATTSSMVFSALLLLPQLPLNRLRLPKALYLFLGLGMYLALMQFLPVLLQHDLRWIFFYNGMVNSTPPPWSAALVPVSITVIFLVCGQFFNRRSEP